LKGEGKTTVATDLAVAYATSGKRVILVDADIRKPDAAQRLGVNEAAGLSQVLAGTMTLADALREVSPFGRALRVLPAGDPPPNPSALLGSLRMSRLLSELQGDADIVILDTTPLLAVSDAFPLLDKVSGIVALVRLDKTPRDAIRRMLHITRSAGGQVLGLVATDGKRALRAGYGYGYGYGDAPGTNGAAPGARQPEQHVQES
jgi:receptor protein-tyrosine kinase